MNDRATKKPRPGWIRAGVTLAALQILPLATVQSAPTAKAPAPALAAKGLALSVQGKPQALFLVERAGLVHLPPDSLRAFLRQARAAGVRAVKTEAYSLVVGEHPALLEGPETLHPGELSKLDALLKAARDEGVGLILTLSAESAPYGGKAEWAKWAGSGNPNVFYLDWRVKSWFQAYASKLLKRVNPLTGTAYGREPSVWAWNLMDGARNEGGEPPEFDRWVAETCAALRPLAPGQAFCLTFDLEAPPGLSVDQAAGIPGGPDFLLYAPASGAPGPTAAKWAGSTGKPVVALFPGPSPGPLEEGVAGAGFRVAGGLDEAKARTLKDAWAALAVPEGAGASSLFTLLEAKSAGPAVFRDEAAVRVTAILSRSAQARVRWGQGGTLEKVGEWKESPGNFQAVLSSLTAGKTLDYVVEAREPGKPPVSSGRRTFQVPALIPVRDAAAPVAPKGFIRVQGAGFVDEAGKPWRYVGTNCYYLHYEGPEAADYVFPACASLGMKVLRIWAFGERPKREVPDWEAKRFFVREPGVYDEENLKRLDRLVVLARKNGVRLILALANNWTDFGGAPQWASYFGYKDKNDFFDKPEVQKAWRGYLAHLVNRTNTLTGVAYKDEPAILAWDLMNEPRYERDPSGRFLAGWCDETAGYLKGLGVRQLVTTGSEGARAAGGAHYSGSDFLLIHRSPHIDFTTLHIYPYFDHNRWSLETTETLVRSYARESTEVLKKPFVLEEFGLPRNDPKYDRPVWVRALLKAFYGAGGDGTNYWMIMHPAYQGGDGNDFTAEELETANVFAVTARELEAAK